MYQFDECCVTQQMSSLCTYIDELQTADAKGVCQNLSIFVDAIIELSSHWLSQSLYFRHYFLFLVRETFKHLKEREECLILICVVIYAHVLQTSLVSTERHIFSQLLELIYMVNWTRDICVLGPICCLYARVPLTIVK